MFSLLVSDCKLEDETFSREWWQVYRVTLKLGS
jgi:hypothetical protein